MSVFGAVTERCHSIVGKKGVLLMLLGLAI